FVLTEQDVVGQLQLNALFLVDNKMTLSHIVVPISQHKELTIQTKTFRDKITPGQKEKWSFTVKQEDKPIATEVLATMYDASLDAFASHTLGSFQFRYPYYPRSNNYHIINAFQQQTYSGNIFTSNFYAVYADNRRDEIYNYDLLSARRGFFGSSLERDVTYEELIDEQAYRATAIMYDELRDPSLLREVLQTRARGVSAVAKQSSPLPASAIMYEPKVEEGATNAEYMVVNEEVAQFRMGSGQTADGEMDLSKDKQLQRIKARTNLQETAFFYPNLYTDEAGNISFEFESPEALTKWKLLLFAHAQHLASASGTYFTQTQKQLMLRPNIPRYFRTNDQLTIKAQIQNLSKERIQGNAKIELIDPRNNQVVSTAFQIDSALKNFSVEASNNSTVAWSLTIPAEYPTIQIRIVAAGGEFSDGEIIEIPVLPNTILIGDTEKIILKAGESKNFTVKGSTKDNLMGRIQVQSNPILEILSALDYLKNYPYECNEQLSSKWFGLKMAQYIQLHYPAVTDYFKKLDVDTKKGRLEENSGLNEFKMEEMPWLRDIQGDAERLKKIAAFFGTDIQAEINAVEQKIRNNQSTDGSFSWFDGGQANTEISIRMLEIIGKVLYLDKSLVNNDIRAMASKLTQYLDRDPAIFSPKASTDMGIDYLFARRYWTEFNPIPKDSLQLLQRKLVNSSLSSAGRSAGLAAKTWIVSQIFGQGKQSMEIKNRLDQEAVIDVQKGMYWKSNVNQYNKISLQSYLVEAYKINNPAQLNQVTQWIYYNKQVNHWYNTWMTVDAIYALLLANNPKDFVIENSVQISINNKKAELSNTVLGEVSKQFDKVDLQTDLDIQVQNHNERTVYGAVVHQYFADLDQIKSTTNALSVQKVYLVERKGQWVESKEAKLGERIKVRITVVNDEPMQYIHLKDSRPAGVEPVFSPSGYQWRKNYYFSSKDASTNYFMDRLSKGRSIYEYEVKANNLGIFNSGITTIESMYDPGVNARSTNTILTIVP
ncbi:MAG: alpha-2-macroglobulin family protein, partial [Sphingobacterium sp.]